MIYKKHVIQKSELTKVKAKGKAVKIKIYLDKIRNEIKLLEEKLDKENDEVKHLEEKNELLKHHNQRIDINNNQLNKNNMFLLENMRNMNELIDQASVYTKRNQA